ncbi:hypothetical protein [Gracilimonas sediminicola]|uniref:Uncharacterized protein n=1 Tax=Gracilimonas sediminicola TaxID=2952158 RepID=A0A9X2L1X1_9BACT|nr:hypothetical protein [Gracilimonas sediminicola]MCP9290811.1 hypothetical protein [Gracilimonas sediminicola]
MSIPFNYSMYETEDVKVEVKEVKGILSFLDGELLFEYKVYDMMGNGLSNLSKFSIQLDHIKKIQYKKGLLFFTGGKLIIEANQWAFFEPLPGSEQGKIKLNIKRNDKNEAIRFSTKINLYMSQKRLGDMEGE